MRMKKLFQFPLYLVASLLFSVPALQGANLIFDLGGVLIDTNKSAVARQVGIGNIVTYIFSTGKGFSTIKQKLYEILHNLDHKAINVCCAKDHDGQELPALMCDWMTGAQTPKEILNIILHAINANPDWFVNTTEKRVIHKLVRGIFIPKHLAKTRSLIKPGIKFVEQCKKDGHKLYILSNWDAESVKELQKNKKFKKFFNLFDGVVISGEYGIMKPNEKFYKGLLSTYNLDPCDCIFFDDQLENIEAAQQLGIHSIPVNNKNFKNVQSAFNTWEQHKQLSNLIWA
jgi:HAD superfamily hydrolase (TIGR01509 family)